MPRFWTVMLRSRALPTLCGTHLQGGVLRVEGGPGMSLPRLSRWCIASDTTPISLQSYLARSLILWHVRSVVAVHGLRPEFNVRARLLDKRPCCCSLAVPNCRTMQHSLSRCGGRLTPSTMPLQHARSPHRSRLQSLCQRLLSHAPLPKPARTGALCRPCCSSFPSSIGAVLVQAAQPMEPMQC